MSPLSVPGSCTADLRFEASSPETLCKGLLADTCSRSAMVLKALNVLPAPCPVLAMGMGGGAAPLLHLPRSNFYVREGNYRRFREIVYKTSTTAAWKYAQIS